MISEYLPHTVLVRIKLVLVKCFPGVPDPGSHSVNPHYVGVDVKDDLIPSSLGIMSRVLPTCVAQALVDPPPLGSGLIPAIDW